MTFPLSISPRHRVAARSWGVAAGLGLGLASLSASAAPPRTANPPSTGGPVELSGDEAQLNSCKKWKPGKRYTITVPPDSELQDLVKWMSTISCQKFIWNGKVRSGKVTILSPEPVTLTEAYAAFYAALEGMGLTVEPAGDYFKIVETSDAKSLNLPMYDGRNVPNNDRFVTQLVRVKSSNPDEIVNVLNKLKSKTGNIEQVGNLLIISDRGSTVRRLQRIVSEIDRYETGSGEKVFFYQLQYADATEIAEILREIFGEDSNARNAKNKNAKNASGASFSRVIVDERTGTLIIVSKPDDYSTIRRLVEQLDVRLPGGGGKIHVKPLKNADPKAVAAVLQSLASGTSSNAKNKKNKGATQGGAAAELFSGDVKVTADEDSHSLVIVASAADYRNLEEVIDQLDAQRRQVYLEIYLLEANVSRDLTAGAGGHVAFPFDTAQGQGVGLVSSAPSPDVNSLLLSPQALTGLAGGALGPLVPGSGQLLGLGQDIPSFGVIIQALHVANDTNVVAEPHVLTSDNKEVQLEVGQRVPTPGALSFGAGGQASLTPLQSINREDVTLNIKVKPHINDEDTVSLDVELEDRDIISTDPTLGVTTTKRRFKLESIMAEDDQPVVLGGLIRERERENVQQVPGLGQIPILGWLFKRKSKIKEKVNLLVIMVPHVVDSPDDVRRIHEMRTRERLEFLERETSFKRRDLETYVNYSSKSGMLSSVDKEARRIEREEILLRQAEEELSAESITGELGDSFEQQEAAPDKPKVRAKARARKK